MSNQFSSKNKFLFLPLALALVISGCSDESSVDQTNNNSQPSQTNSNNQPGAVNQVDPSELNNGTTGITGTTDTSGTSGTTGTTDTSGTTGTTDTSGTSGTTDTSGTTGTTDTSGTTGTTGNNINPNTNAQQYEDTYLQLSYPEGWTLDTTNPSVSAIFLEPGLNEQQGKNNCVLTSEVAPESSLMQVTDEIITLYDDNPEAEISFLNVNGTEMSRVYGSISLLGLTIDSRSQLAFKDQVVHIIICAGVSAEDVELIFNSMVIR